MKQGELVNDFRVPPNPKGISLEGSFVILKPLIASQFANELFLSNAIDIEGVNWIHALQRNALTTERKTCWLPR